MYIENVGEYLKENGIKPSIQRIKIFQYLLEHHSHPTVDDIFQSLSTEIPTLSKTTVYNTLNIFVESHIVHEVIIEENEVRYDVITGTHGHFKCKICGEITDFDIDLSKLDLQKLGHVEIEETHFYLKGTCVRCLRDKRKN
ncbi:transcriptional repressor [Leptotrichia sp. OH3620_COT-345]|uniref:Fur family transcriptional regulator n=1 Tax=Leptotrichia sp. OH3620_COT-345 TaxID=2491048 RepID=UPI000F652DD0|nr:Fur family transcriptional regulator [Leptotrichia sp. OH3620_COT-345]RRD38467.1 transcriptional repressor [Leptotrichia sp. OH3620_COT-345]